MMEGRAPARPRSAGRPTLQRSAALATMTLRSPQSICSDWRPLAGWKPSPTVLTEVLDGGQSVRWRHDDAGGAATPPRIWTGIWLDNAVQLRRSHDALHWHGADETAVHRYLALGTDWAALTDSLPWRSDAHLARCIAAFPDLRILRQPFGETLLGFLCSATKQIVQIKQMVALLAERHGSEIGRARTPFRAESAAKGLAALPFHRLPTWSELAAIPEKDLRACLLGFRAKYIHETASFIARRPGWLEETELLPYAAAKVRLMELPGVGEKVADCVLLFGAGRLEAFPVDTWVLKSLARRYGLDGWKPAQVAHFGRTHFGPLAGLAQQYLFAWERRHGGR
jgi:N-glycosylase/DNA lyase